MSVEDVESTRLGLEYKTGLQKNGQTHCCPRPTACQALCNELLLSTRDLRPLVSVALTKSVYSIPENPSNDDPAHHNPPFVAPPRPRAAI